MNKNGTSTATGACPFFNTLFELPLLVMAVPKNDVEEQKRILEFAFRMIDESNH